MPHISMNRINYATNAMYRLYVRNLNKYTAWLKVDLRCD